MLGDEEHLLPYQQTASSLLLLGTFLAQIARVELHARVATRVRANPQRVPFGSSVPQPMWHHRAINQNRGEECYVEQTRGSVNSLGWVSKQNLGSKAFRRHEWGSVVDPRVRQCYQHDAVGYAASTL